MGTVCVKMVAIYQTFFKSVYTLTNSIDVEPVILDLEFENYTVTEENSVRVCAQLMNGHLLNSTITLQLRTMSPLHSDSPGSYGVLVILFCKYYSLLFFISATADEDYTSIPELYQYNTSIIPTSYILSGRLTFISFITNQTECITISTFFDLQVEGTEDFLVQLQMIGPLPPNVKLARTNATVFILDNDGMLQ